MSRNKSESTSALFDEQLINADEIEALLQDEQAQQEWHRYSVIRAAIKGDLKYGFPRSNKDGSIHLHSRKIEFQHPISKNIITITANPPKNIIWDLCIN